MKIDFVKKLEKRRSRYYLSNKSPITKQQIVELLKDVVKNTPSAFNSQGSRIVILFGEAHLKLWQITKEALLEKIGTKNFSSTDKRIDGFANSFGTILFFEDQLTIKSYQNNLPSYKENFSIWANQSNGMLQYAIWTTLALEGLGASLQHYNPLIDSRVHEYFEISKDWMLIAQMPFGQPTKDADAKTFMDINERVKVIN